MSIFSNLFGKQKPQLPQFQYDLQAVVNQILQQGKPLYNDGNAANNIKAYANNADVYSIIRLIAKTSSLIPKYAYIVKDKKAYLKFLQVKQNKGADNYEERYHESHTKALELADGSDLQRLIMNPCPNLDRQEFETGVYTYKLSTGNTFLYIAKPDLGSSKGKPSHLHLMPPDYVAIVCTNGFPKMITGYEMNVVGLQKFSKEDVIHLKYFNPNFTNEGQELYGLSPLKAALKTVERSNSAKDAQVAQFQNGGPKVLVGNDNLTADEIGVAAAGKIKAYWEKEYGGANNAGKWALVPGKPNAISLGISPVDLDIIAGEKFTLSQLCNVFGVSDVLLNNSSASTESNVREMVKRLYTNTCLPECYSYCDAINAKISPLLSDKGKMVVECDLSEISELQEDFLKKSQAASQSPIFIPNNVLEQQGYGRMKDPLMDKVYVKQGYVPLEDVALGQMPNDPNGDNLRL